MSTAGVHGWWCLQFVMSDIEVFYSAMAMQSGLVKPVHTPQMSMYELQTDTKLGPQHLKGEMISLNAENEIEPLGRYCLCCRYEQNGEKNSKIASLIPQLILSLQKNCMKGAPNLNPAEQESRLQNCRPPIALPNRSQAIYKGKAQTQAGLPILPDSLQHSNKIICFCRLSSLHFRESQEEIWHITQGLHLPHGGLSEVAAEVQWLFIQMETLSLSPDFGYAIY